MPDVEQRIETIDFLRGFAALWVCWFHLTQANTFVGPGLFNFTGRYGGLGVEIFFVISGFIIPYALQRGGYTLKKFHVFLAKRVTRLDPPYLVSIVLALAVGFALTLAPNYQGEPFRVDSVGLLLHLGYLNVLFGYEWLSPVYWTLAIEFQYYLLIGLAFPLVSSPRRWHRMLFFAALALLAWRIRFGGYIFVFIFLFFMGMSLFQYKAKLIGRAELLILLTVFTCGSYLLLGTGPTLAGVGTVLAISFLSVRHWAFTFLGSISYSLYLIHPPVKKVVYTLGRKFTVYGPARIALPLIGLAAAIGAAYLLYVLVERPSPRWSSSFRYKRRAKVEPDEYGGGMDSSAAEGLARP